MQLNQNIVELLKKYAVSEEDEEFIIYSGYLPYKVKFPLDEKKSYFNTDDAAYKQFFDALHNDYLNGVKYWMNEKQYTNVITHSGIVVDIDAYQMGPARILSEYHCTELVKKLAKIIYEYTEIDGDYQTVGFVLTNPAPYHDKEAGAWKEGIHILFPGIKVDRQLKSMIIEQYSKRCTELLKSYKFHAKKEDKIIDMNCTNVPMQIYGTIREGKTASHQLLYAFNITMGKKIMSENVTGRYAYVKRLDKTPPSSNANLPLELSIHYEGDLPKRVFAARVNLQNIVAEGYNSFIHRMESDEEVIDKEAKMLCELHYRAAETDSYVRCLKQSRGASGSYKEWSNVMFVILMINPKFMPIAKMFSIACDRDCWYNKDGLGALNKILEKVEQRLRRSPDETEEHQKYFNILSKMAKEDNPVKWSEIRQKTLAGRIEYMLKNNMVITQYQIAKIVCDLVGDRFRCIPMARVGVSTVANCYWLEHVTEERTRMPKNIKPFIYKWCRQDLYPLEIHHIIAETIAGLFDRSRAFYMSKLKDAAKPEAEGIKAIIAKLTRAIELCQTMGSMEAIKKTCQIELVDENILQIMDKSPNVIGVANGILVFENSHATAPATVRLVQEYNKYYISQTTNIPYEPYNSEDRTIIKVERFLSEMIPNEQHRQGLMMHFSQFFVSMSADRYFTILYSGGASGKSQLMKLFQTMMGMRGSSGQNVNFGYYNTIDSNTFIYDKKDVNSVDHQMIKFHGARLVQAPEGKRGVIQTSIIKKLRDDFGARAMFGDVKNSNFGGIVVCTANANMEFSEYTYALQRRFLYYSMPVRFDPDVAKDAETETLRHMDKKIEDKVLSESWGRAILSIMVRYWIMLKTKYGTNTQRMYVETGLYDITMNYINNYNFINRFASYMVEDREGSVIVMQDLCKIYVSWLQRISGDRQEKAPRDVVDDIREYFKDHVVKNKDTGNDEVHGIGIKKDNAANNGNAAI